MNALYEHKPAKITSIADLITFFEAIPKEQWCVGLLQNFKGQRCAVGHLGFAYRGQAGEGWDVIALAFGLDHDLHELASANNNRGIDPKAGTLEFLNARRSALS